MARVTEPSFKFWFDEKYYTVQGAETMVRMGTKDDLSTMRSEYTRMRDVAQKRIKRLEKKFPESKAYQAHAKGFPKLKELDLRDFAKAFSDLAKFVKAKGSTVTGQKQIQEKTINTINKAIGASPNEEDEEDEENASAKLNKKNYWRFIKILEEARRQKVVYDSNKMVTLAETTLELNNDQFDSVLDKLSSFIENVEDVQDDLDTYMKRKDIKDYQQVDMDDFIKQIGW